MPWLVIGVVLALVGLLLLASTRRTPYRYIPWINFNFGGNRPPDTNALRALEDDAVELARDRPPKDVAP